MVEVGGMAPLFCLPDSNRNEVCLKSYLGQWVILYFYPRDNTSGCTREAADFTNALSHLGELNAEVLGVSPNSPESHKTFAEKHGLKITLLSDEGHEVMEAYGVWAMKRMYGKEGYGVIRSTFLISPQGHIAHLWRSVKVKGHVDEVLKTLNRLVDRA